MTEEVVDESQPITNAAGVTENTEYNEDYIIVEESNEEEETTEGDREIE